MLIQVHYHNDNFDYVNEKTLQTLIESKKISGFRRSSGWVTIGINPLREFERNFKNATQEETTSIVRVEYEDKTYDYVSEKSLNKLIESNQIVKFKRISGWVTLGVDPLRNSNREHTYRYPNEIKKRNKSE
jgi:hypothetical protein